MRAAVAGTIAAVAWSWALLRQLATLRKRRPTRADPHHKTRRSYVFGAISRETFDAAIRKTGWRSSRDRVRKAK
jgi:hypothetical protein